MLPSVLEEKLREAACYGDLDSLTALLKEGVNVNSAHAINGWTALHWACKRGHVQCKNALISWGADVDVLNKAGEAALSLEPNHNASESSSCGKEPEITTSVSISSKPYQHSNDIDNKEFVPNYPKYPEFNHKVDLQYPMKSDKQTKYENATKHEENISNKITTSYQHDLLTMTDHTQLSLNHEILKKKSSIIIKTRLMKLNTNSGHSVNSFHLVISESKHNPCSGCPTLPISMSYPLCLIDNDFIEIDIPLDDLTIRGFLGIALAEFHIPQYIKLDPNGIYIRKLPNTRLRRDIEIARLVDYEEIEIGFICNCDTGKETFANWKRNCIVAMENNSTFKEGDKKENKKIEQ